MRQKVLEPDLATQGTKLGLAHLVSDHEIRTLIRARQILLQSNMVGSDIVMVGMLGTSCFAVDGYIFGLTPCYMIGTKVRECSCPLGVWISDVP